LSGGYVAASVRSYRAPLKTMTVLDGEGVTEIDLWRMDKPEGQEPNTVKD
jgi:hypothetical protein